jgi:hypothetical protein
LVHPARTRYLINLKSLTICTVDGRTEHIWPTLDVEGIEITTLKVGRAIESMAEYPLSIAHQRLERFHTKPLTTIPHPKRKMSAFGFSTKPWSTTPAP